MKIDSVLHMNLLKTVVSFTGGTSLDSVFWPLSDSSAEGEVENLLDICVCHHIHSYSTEYLVKWYRYNLAKSTWEHMSNFTNCPKILSTL